MFIPYMDMHMLEEKQKYILKLMRVLDEMGIREINKIIPRI